MFDNINDTREILSADRYDFPVAKVPLFVRNDDGDMRMVPTDAQQAVVREDTGEVLATVGGRYEITEHKPLFDGVTEALLASGLDVSNVQVKDGIFEGGARARRQIILPNEVVEPQVGDRMHLMLSILNSIDGRWAFKVEFSYFRLICRNGMVTKEFGGGMYAKHTAKLNVEALSKQMAARLEMMARDEAEFAAWTRQRVTEEQVSEFFAKTLARVKRRGLEDDINKTLHQRLMARFAAEPTATVYSVWNAMTAWSTHEEIRRGAAHNVALARESAVAGAMRSPQWNALIHGERVEDAEIIAA